MKNTVVWDLRSWFVVSDIILVIVFLLNGCLDGLDDYDFHDWKSMVYAKPLFKVHLSIVNTTDYCFILIYSQAKSAPLSEPY